MPMPMTIDLTVTITNPDGSVCRYVQPVYNHEALHPTTLMDEAIESYLIGHAMDHSVLVTSHRGGVEAPSY